MEPERINKINTILKKNRTLSYFLIPLFLLTTIVEIYAIYEMFFKEYSYGIANFDILGAMFILLFNSIFFLGILISLLMIKSENKKIQKILNETKDKTNVETDNEIYGTDQKEK